MAALLEFFRGIGESIVAVINFIINLFKDMVDMIFMLVDVISRIPSYFSWLPSEVLLLFGVILSVIVMYKIIGREG